MSHNEFKNKNKLGALAILFSAMMVMSAVCFATVATAANNINNVSTMVNFTLENPIKPLFSGPTVTDVVPHTGYITVEDVPEQSHLHDVVTCRVYNCPIHPVETTPPVSEITCLVYNCPICKH